jgi:hypothetical protein
VAVEIGHLADVPEAVGEQPWPGKRQELHRGTD